MRFVILTGVVPSVKPFGLNLSWSPRPSVATLLRVDSENPSVCSDSFHQEVLHIFRRRTQPEMPKRPPPSGSFPTLLHAVAPLRCARRPPSMHSLYKHYSPKKCRTLRPAGDAPSLQPACCRSSLHIVSFSSNKLTSSFGADLVKYSGDSSRHMEYFQGLSIIYRGFKDQASRRGSLRFWRGRSPTRALVN